MRLRIISDKLTDTLWRTGSLKPKPDIVAVTNHRARGTVRPSYNVPQRTTKFLAEAKIALNKWFENSLLKVLCNTRSRICDFKFEHKSPSRRWGSWSLRSENVCVCVRSFAVGINFVGSGRIFASKRSGNGSIRILMPARDGLRALRLKRGLAAVDLCSFACTTNSENDRAPSGGELQTVRNEVDDNLQDSMDISPENHVFHASCTSWTVLVALLIRRENYTIHCFGTLELNAQDL
ncbi:putative histidine kinase HHK5p, partial [Aureobasidium melanogenum]